MSNGYVVIQSEMLQDLVVSNDPSGSGSVSLQWLNGNDQNQLWTMEPTTNGFYLLNAATGTYLAATGSNSPVVLNAHGDVWQKTGPDDQFSAIRLTLNTSQNLNAVGGSPAVGTTVGTWTWGKGGSNENWIISSLSAVWPRPTQTQTFTSGLAAYLQLSINPADSTGALVVDDNYSNGAPAAYFAFAVTNWFSGFSIVNQQSGLLAYISGSGNGSSLLQRSASTMDQTALWTYGSPGTWQAVRPWINSTQNWNVFGNPHPIPSGALAMGTWKWGGGQANEIWQTSTVSASEVRRAGPSPLWQAEAAAPAEIRAGNGFGHSAAH